MPKFKKASADEFMSKRKDHVRGDSQDAVLVKGFRSPKTWNKDERSAVFIMSTETIDRYGDIVVQAGMETDRFMENPQGLLFHNSRSWPCGTWSEINKILSGRPRRTEGKLTFLPEGTDEDADRAARHVAAGTLRTVSIGFRPDYEEIEFILDDDGDWTGGFRFNKSELLECSVVPIPAQPDALVKDAGGDFRLARDLIEEVLDTYAKTPEGLLLPMDEYRAKYADVAGERSFHVVRDGLIPREPKVAARGDLTLKASNDDEASAYVGATVRWDPGHTDNSEEPALMWAKAEGEVIASWIVPSGEFEGVHALNVEWSEDGVPVGMYRGLKADRVLLVKSDTPDASESQPADDEGLADFLVKIQIGDTVRSHYQLAGRTAIEKGFTLERDGTDCVEKVEFKEGVTAEHRKALAERLVEVHAEADGQEATDKSSGPVVLKVTADTTEVEEAAERVGGIFAKLAEKFPMFFPKSTQERIEPTLPESEPAAPPSAEQVEAALAKAASTRERLASKGLISA